MSEILEELLYTDTHEWIKEEDNDIYTIGITDYAQNELGDVVYIELPEVNDEIIKGEEFGSIESVKAVSELIAPVSGIVVEINEKLSTNPELVNKSPYEEGWLIKIKVKSKEELNTLLSPEEYKDIIE